MKHIPDTMRHKRETVGAANHSSGTITGSETNKGTQVNLVCKIKQEVEGIKKHKETDFDTKQEIN